MGQEIKNWLFIPLPQRTIVNFKETKPNKEERNFTAAYKKTAGKRMPF